MEVIIDKVLMWVYLSKKNVCKHVNIIQRLYTPPNKAVICFSSVCSDSCRTLLNLGGVLLE